MQCGALLCARYFRDLAHVVVDPPDVRVVLALGAEVRLAERGHRTRAGAAPAHGAELEEAAEAGAVRAEEVVIDQVGRAQRRVRDARRVPEEEGRVRERARRSGHGIEHRVHELEQVADVGERQRIVALQALRAAERRLSSRSRAAGDLPEAAGSQPRLRIEVDLPAGAGELAREERAVAADAALRHVGIGHRAGLSLERAQHVRDGEEVTAQVVTAVQALLVPSREHAVERREAPRRGVVRDREHGAVRRQHVEVGRRRRGNRRAGLCASALAGGAVVALALVVGDEEDDVGPRPRCGRQAARIATGTGSARRAGDAAGTRARLRGAAGGPARLVGRRVEGIGRLAECALRARPPHRADGHRGADHQEGE